MTCREAELFGDAVYQRRRPRTRGTERILKTHRDLRGMPRAESYFTVDVGIRQLDQETGTYNIKGALETALELSRQRVHTLGILETARYAVNTLCFWAVLVVLVLQFGMW